MLNVLVVDDEELIRKMIKDYLKKEGINVIEAKDGIEATQIFNNTSNIDVIVLDVMMPKMDGIEVLKQIRKTSNVPILLLTARVEFEDEVLGLKTGANDYIDKPFSLEALLLKIKKITNTEDTAINIELLEEEKCVKKNGRKIELTKKEYDLLNYLITNKGRVLSRDMILDRIWGRDYFGDYRTVDTHIKKIRRKIDENQEYIKTYRGVGYKFEV